MSSVSDPTALIGRYLAGELSPEEAEQIRAYLDAHPGRRGVVAGVRAAVRREASSAMPDPAVALGEFRVLLQQLEARELNGRTTPARRFTPQVLRIAAYAAVACVAIGLGTYALRRGTPSHVIAKTYATHAGQQAVVAFADGSRMTLAPRTTVTLRTDADTHERTAILTGEAHFDITPSTHAPFTVRAGSSTVRVLGTTFDVRRYPGESRGRVIVWSGRVAVATRGAPMTLAAGMVGVFSDSAVTMSADAEQTVSTDWTQGRLVFRHAPVTLVLDALKRWYGYDFRLADSSLVREYVTTTFTLGDTRQTLQRLKTLLGVRMTFEDSVVTLHPDHDMDAPPARRSKLSSHDSEVGR